MYIVIQIPHIKSNQLRFFSLDTLNFRMTLRFEQFRSTLHSFAASVMDHFRELFK